MENKKIILAKSPVVFDAETHTYTLDGLLLNGVTGMIGRQLFPNAYADVPEDVLAKAAERGSSVHTDIQMYDMGFTGILPSLELASYKHIKKEYGLTTLANEYLVSDMEYFASKIDLVFDNGDGTVSLADIKTTYKPNYEYVRWQLSIYAYLFGLQNKGIEVKDIYLVWLRDSRWKFEKLNRVHESEVTQLMMCERNGVQYTPPLAESGTMYPAEFLNAQKALAEVEQAYKEAKERRDMLTAGLLELMQKYDIKKFEGEHVALTRKAAGTRETFDTARFKTEHPELYTGYVKTSKTKESLLLRLKD